MKRSAAVFSCVLAGCTAVEEVRAPEDDRASAAIFAFLAEDDLDLFAVHWPLDQALEYEPGDQEVRIQILLYEESLENLGIAEGALAIRDQGAPLPRPDRIREQRVGSPLSWRDSELDPRLADVKIERTIVCRSFTAVDLTPQILDNGISPLAFIGAGDHGYVLAEGEIYSLRGDTLAPYTTLDFVARGLYAAPDGTMYTARDEIDLARDLDRQRSAKFSAGDLRPHRDPFDQRRYEDRRPL